jgi:hypothetical protein
MERSAITVAERSHAVAALCAAAGLVTHLTAEGMRLPNLNLEGVDLSDTSFKESLLTGLVACRSRLERAQLQGADLQRAGVHREDAPYGQKGARKDTPDVVLHYSRRIVAVEIVSGPMQARTLTHGDPVAFDWVWVVTVA